MTEGLFIALGVLLFIGLPLIVRSPKEIELPTEVVYTTTQSHEPRVRSSAQKGRKGRYH